MIGVGNPLRGDDAAGWRVAEAIEALHLPGVEVRCTHQLQVELSQILPDYQKVVVVDASLHGPSVSLRPIQPSKTAAASSHALDPWSLQELARMTHGRCPLMLLCTLQAESFDLGSPLSPQMTERIRQAVDAITRALDSP